MVAGGRAEAARGAVEALRVVPIQVSCAAAVALLSGVGGCGRRPGGGRGRGRGAGRREAGAGQRQRLVEKEGGKSKYGMTTYKGME